MKRAGASTFAQDEASAAIDGMPRAAREDGAAERVLAPAEIAEALVRATRRA
jgi:two-component system chemotaxis response regulator CheB